MGITIRQGFAFVAMMAVLSLSGIGAGAVLEGLTGLDNLLLYATGGLLVICLCAVVVWGVKE